MVESHAGESIAEVGDLLPPSQVIPASAVREIDRRTLTVSLIVERNVPSSQRGHLASDPFLPGAPKHPQCG
jgi:hypothetical protein